VIDPKPWSDPSQPLAHGGSAGPVYAPSPTPPARPVARPTKPNFVATLTFVAPSRTALPPSFSLVNGRRRPDVRGDLIPGPRAPVDGRDGLIFSSRVRRPNRAHSHEPSPHCKRRFKP